MSTVGFGDVYPKTELGRLCVIVMIITMLAVIPTKVEGLSKVLTQTSKYSRISFKKKDKDYSDHILILGNT